MQTFFIEYRDPLFGAIIFFGLIAVISISSYWFALFRRDEKLGEINIFLKNFYRDSDSYIKELNSIESLPIIKDLAESFKISQDYQKAIKLYQHLLNRAVLDSDRFSILRELAILYLRVGFIQRADELFLTLIKFNSRDIVALKNLLIISEKMQNFKREEDILDSLDELLDDREYLLRERAFLNFNRVKFSQLNLDQKVSKLFEINQNIDPIDRLIVNFLIESDIQILYSNLDKLQLESSIDLLWHLKDSKLNLDIISTNQFFSEVVSARGYHLKKRSDIFELSTLIELNSFKKRADLEFKYRCKSCNRVYPIYFDRCPNCLSLLDFKIEKFLVELK